MDWTTLLVAIAVPVISFLTGVASTKLRQRDTRHNLKLDMELLEQVPEGSASYFALRKSIDERIMHIAFLALPSRNTYESTAMAKLRRLTNYLLFSGSLMSFGAMIAMALMFPGDTDLKVPTMLDVLKGLNWTGAGLIAVAAVLTIAGMYLSVRDLRRSKKVMAAAGSKVGSAPPETSGDAPATGTRSRTV